MVKLTKRVVDTALAEPKDYVLWDDELPGFGLRIFPSGSLRASCAHSTHAPVSWLGPMISAI